LRLVSWLGCPAWYLAQYWIRHGTVDTSETTAKALPRLVFRLAIDLYTILFTVVLIVAYWYVFCQARWISQSPEREAIGASSLIGATGTPPSPIRSITVSVVAIHPPVLTWYCRCFVLAAGIVAGLRVYEIFGFICRLHTRRLYATKAPVRALANTIWHYLEVAIAFALLYLIVFIFAGDRFGTRPMTDTFVTPLYFSFINPAIKKLTQSTAQEQQRTE
jgi:hypothetical protein